MRSTAAPTWLASFPGRSAVIRLAGTVPPASTSV